MTVPVSLMEQMGKELSLASGEFFVISQSPKTTQHYFPELLSLIPLGFLRALTLLSAIIQKLVLILNANGKTLQDLMVCMTRNGK